MEVTVAEFLDALWHYDKPIIFIKDLFLESVEDEIRAGNLDLIDYAEFAIDHTYVTAQTKYYLKETFAKAKVSAFDIFDYGMIIFVEYEDDNNKIREDNLSLQSTGEEDG